MNWFTDLITQPTYLQTVIFLSLICAVGLGLGQIKYKGVTLGVTFVFFAGIALGEIADRCGIQVDWDMVTMAQNFGLILFVYTLGVQVGPGFFTSLKQGGIKLNGLGLLAIALTTALPVILSLVLSIPFPEMLGVMCGAVTNTPMLGAGQQALLDIHPGSVEQASEMATACAVAYPFGVIGVLVSIIIMRFTLREKNKRPGVDQTVNTFVAEFHVSNPAIFDKTVKEISALSGKGFILTRLWREGKVFIPTSGTVLAKDDHLLAVSKKEDVDSLNILFGDIESKDWNRPDINWDDIDNSHLVSKHVLVTRHELNGVKLGSLHLRNSFGINITRVNRAGIQILASPGMRLQLGDSLTVVGEENAIAKVSEILGNEVKELNNPNLIAIFIGLLLGVVLGSIPIMIPGMSTPLKLGIAGGPIVIGILIGAFGPRFHLATYTTRSANLMLRQFGIVIYLACLGFSAGKGFLATILCMKGLIWIALSLAIATIPVLLTAVIAKKWGKLDYAQNTGMICAAMANPMAMTYASTTQDEDEAAEAYATVYPLSMFIRVISAQLLMLLLV